MVDAHVLDALIVSSAMAVCELPDHADGDVNVAIGRNIGTGNVGMVTFFRQTRVVEVVPSSGPEAGGTLVAVKTLSERQSPSQCRFGTTGPVATRVSSAAAYQCTSPSHRAITSPLILSIVSSGIGSHALFSFLSASPLLGDISPTISRVSMCKYFFFVPPHLHLLIPSYSRGHEPFSSGSPLDVGTDNILRSTNALFYNYNSKTLCKSRSAASGFMVICVSNITPCILTSSHSRSSRTFTGRFCDQHNDRSSIHTVHNT
jgi:hypothetical protein